MKGPKSGLFGKPVPRTRKEKIRSGVNKSYASGTNERWNTPEKHEAQSVRMTGDKNPNAGNHTPEEQKIRQKTTLVQTRKDHPEILIQLSENLKKYHREHPEAGLEQSIKVSLYYEDPLHRKEQSERLSKHYEENPLSEEECLKRASYILKYIEEHPECRKEHSEWMKQNNPSKQPEVAKKIAASMRKWHAEHPLPKGTGWCRGGYFIKRNGERVWLRSSYETRYAGILSTIGRLWEYEPQRFYLPSLDSTYCPDFYLPEEDIFVEVKGRMSDENIAKLSEFHNVYPQETLIIVNLNHLEDIEHELGCYSPIVLSDFGILLGDFLSTHRPTHS